MGSSAAYRGNKMIFMIMWHDRASESSLVNECCLRYLETLLINSAEVMVRVKKKKIHTLKMTFEGMKVSILIPCLLKVDSV